MPYWRSERKWKAGIATLLLVLLTLAQVALAIWISYWHRELFDALEAGTLTLRIGERFVLAAAADAHRALESRGTTGKLILVP